MDRRRALMAKKPNKDNGLNVTLYKGENGDVGKLAYQYIVDNGVDDGYGNKDWYATDEENLYITGSLCSNERVNYAYYDEMAKYIYLNYEGMSNSYFIILYADGTLDMWDDD